MNSDFFRKKPDYNLVQAYAFFVSWKKYIVLFNGKISKSTFQDYCFKGRWNLFYFDTNNGGLIAGCTMSSSKYYMHIRKQVQQYKNKKKMI